MTADEIEAYREQALHELYLAILALRCGEPESAVTHAKSAIGWAEDIA